MRKQVAGAAVFLAMAMPMAASNAQAAKPELVAVELSSFKFSPAALVLQHGRTYRLHLVNTSGGGHDFTAPEFFAASDIAAADRSQVVDGKVKLTGKQSVDLVVTPERPGTYELRCSHFLHSGMGMRGSITVE